MKDFDRTGIEYDVPTVETPFQPVSSVFNQFWSNPIVAAKYPILSKVASFVSTFEVKS